MLPITRQSRYEAFDLDVARVRNLTFRLGHYHRSWSGAAEVIHRNADISGAPAVLGPEPGLAGPAHLDFAGSAPQSCHAWRKPGVLSGGLTAAAVKATHFVCFLQSGLCSSSGLARS